MQDEVKKKDSKINGPILENEKIREQAEIAEQSIKVSKASFIKSENNH